VTVFIDASALVAMIAREPEASSFADYLCAYSRRLTSPIAFWEAARGVASARGLDVNEARLLVSDFLAAAAIDVVSIDLADADCALDAHRRYGKGVHEARLNLGDCFAYACTKRHEAHIMFKGEDFIHTDLRDATLP